MGLEEIENRLGSLVKTETISQLKSSVWKERLEGLLNVLRTLLLISMFFLIFLSFARVVKLVFTTHKINRLFGFKYLPVW